MASLYKQDLGNIIHRGSIFRFSPIFWLRPPLWIARVTSWTNPRSVDIYRESEVNAFRVSPENEEYVLATAKRRFVVVLSNDNEGKQSRFKDLLVAPIMSIEDKSNLERRREIAVTIPHYFFLEPSPQFPDLKESYVDLRDTRLLHKDFLTNKANYSLTETATLAMLDRYRAYLLTVV